MTFVDMVVQHARNRPSAIAVRQWDRTLTYAELCTRAAGLAGWLAGRGALVGVCMPRTPDLVVAILGVLMSGAGYVPLDPSLPRARRDEMARQAGLDTIVDSLHSSPGELPDLSADDTAYVMFTSGSTGSPKGVVITHASLAEFVTNLASVAGLDERCRSLGFASIGFDASVIDLLAPLAVGGEVALASAEDRADPVRLQRFCASHGATVAFLPPAILPVLDPGGLPDLRVVLTGSEAPGPEQVHRWTAGGRRFFNLYGPTESTVYVTWFEATGVWDRPLPIGRPALNRRIYIVDGELLVGGAGLAAGYLGAPGLTAEKFIPDPFSGIPGARLYRTGDLVQQGPDGLLEFAGRVDRQVKIRGQRVELGEIEAVLRGHPDVTHAAVAVLPGPTLVAFVTGPAEAGEVRAHCALKLPTAMVPSRVVVVDELPLLSSGKVDVGRLEATKPARGPVAEIWQELLGPAGPDDDFFDRGGHSITAMLFVAALRARLRRDVSIEDILEGRSLSGIAARVEAAAPLDGTRPVRGRAPAPSPAQRRLWFLERYSPEGAAAYNVALAERLRGPLDVDALQRALAAVAARHEILRWRLPSSDDGPSAVADPPGAVPLPVIDTDPGELEVLLHEEVSRHFDLATGPLWRCRLYRLGPQDHVLAVVAHHAVFDGWSQALLYKDLSLAYGGSILDPLPATYADYVAWRAERRRQRGDADLDWWVSHVEGAPTVLEIPGKRPAEQTFAGAQTALWLDHAQTADLLALARDLGATPAAVVLAAFGIALARVTGQAEMVIGSPMVDRRDPDFEDMIGFFIEIAPLRLQTSFVDTFADHVRAARDELLAALAHPEAPLERIVHAFGLGGRVDRGPLVQVLFNMFNFPAPSLDLGGIAGEPVPVRVPGSAFDLTLYGEERDGRMRLEAVYNADLFGQARVRSLLEMVRHIITTGDVGDPVPLSDPPRARRRPPMQPSAGVRPATPTEQTIAAVWCDVLGRETVGVTDNFFDSGGDSLAIAVIRQRLNRLLDRSLRVVDLFRYPTIRALGGFLDGADAAGDAVSLALARGAARRNRRSREA